MYKYLLPLLVSFSVNAEYHFGTFKFKEGTITIRGGTDIQSQTIKAIIDGKGYVYGNAQSHQPFTSDLIVTHKNNDWINYGNATVTHELVPLRNQSISKTIDLAGMRSDKVVSIGTFSAEQDEMLQYRFTCDLPVELENKYVDGKQFTLVYRAKTTTPSYPEFVYNVECKAIYEREKSIELSLSPEILDISGANNDGLKGETQLTLLGSHGSVYLEIKNPNYRDLSVSFDENRIVEHQSFLVDNSTHTFPIFVKYKAKEPGMKTYAVSINATIT